mmetsp:Transcript_32686/g.53361  ORF Transcript_32686/g.53361 Transcript_32686/m.53361 type:complete len:105 (-) Transcript_32686:306-620(-)
MVSFGGAGNMGPAKTVAHKGSTHFQLRRPEISMPENGLPDFMTTQGGLKFLTLYICISRGLIIGMLGVCIGQQQPMNLTIYIPAKCNSICGPQDCFAVLWRWTR